mmetsp:Transcript_13848/g.34152  ORF Transcript_13848/g.34152 Transcript_13848/m.34152 type:complete len:203 (-) Transcript_13848:1011-1619(-)
MLALVDPRGPSSGPNTRRANSETWSRGPETGGSDRSPPAFTAEEPCSAERRLSRGPLRKNEPTPPSPEDEADVAPPLRSCSVCARCSWATCWRSLFRYWSHLRKKNSTFFASRARFSLSFSNTASLLINFSSEDAVASCAWDVDLDAVLAADFEFEFDEWSPLLSRRLAAPPTPLSSALSFGAAGAAASGTRHQPVEVRSQW